MIIKLFTTSDKKKIVKAVTKQDTLHTGERRMTADPELEAVQTTRL